MEHLPRSKEVAEFASMDTFEIRRHNLIALMDRVYGAGVRGAKTALAKRLDKQPDYISRCLYPPEKAGRKNIGEEFARQIENTYGLQRYELDVQPGQEIATVFIGENQNSSYVVDKSYSERKIKTHSFWSVDLLLDHIKHEDQKSKNALLKTLRDEIAHGVEARKIDRHRFQKLMYALGTAATDKMLTDTEFSMLESAVVCVSARYELIEAEAKIAEYKKMGFDV
ncbi:hypothetical protein [Pseudomonas fluorescens]|uniref:hypothetical protein n=1 Tax=Pseudomonas fluorescens TaxID=294 RepID=UPI001CA64369|nr:hypothetical protein [Pseudomonas fluorescens]MBY8934237.1 hypothetical protein [Pseudomonas fluorescens]